MKKSFLFILIALASIASALGATEYYGDINGDGEVTIHDAAQLISILLGDEADNTNGRSDANNDGSVNITDLHRIVQIILGAYDKEAMPGSDVDTLYITYADGTATYKLPSAWSSYVTVTVNGGDVTVTNNNITDEYVTSLSGNCDDGSFTYNGSYKTTIALNGVHLTNSDGAAIDIECGKRVALELADGTTNTLIDGNGSQKAALYCKGHMEISRGGSLAVTGTKKHAISSKEYILVKKTAGSITVNGSASDGIHCGQYFQMNGGSIDISGISGDGIQAEMLADNSADDGKIIIKGGTINIQTDSTDVAALKCDSTLHIKDGDLTIVTKGNIDKGMKSKGAIDIEGGTIDITQTGTYTVSGIQDADGNVTYDASYVTAIKADSTITISGGSITINNTADGGKGISSDQDIIITGGTQTINANGAGGVLDTTGANITEGSGTEEEPKSYRFYIAMPSSSTSSQQGPGGMSGSSSTITWSNIQLYTSSGTLVATLTDQASVAGTSGTTTTFYYYDFSTATSGNYYVTASYSATSSGGNNRPGGQSSSSPTTGTFTSSTLTLNLTGTDLYYSVSATSSSSGSMGGWGGQSSSSTYTFSTSDVTSTYSGGAVAAEEGDTYTAACIKSDGNVTLSGGIQTLTHTGVSSKGVKADGCVTLNGASITDTAGGSYMIVGTDPSYSTAVRCGSFAGESGALTVYATGQASRGISSEGTLTITGGTYDLTLSGDGTTFTSGSETDGCASVGIKSDGNMQLLAGDITINSSAKGGKGIKIGTSDLSGASGATLTIGANGADNSLLKLDVNTTGTYLSTASGSSSGQQGPGGMGGGGMNEGFIGSTKAVKCMGPITVNSGNIHLSTNSDGGEGLESKYTITFNGGILESDTYDDGINAANQITFNDGCYVWAHSSGNDGIDSNGSGFMFNGGVICSSGTNAPEEGFDCDQNNFVVNGGILIGTGGSTSSVTSASQGYGVSSLSITAGAYLSVLDSSGNVLCTYKCPNTTSGSVLVSHPTYSSGSSISVKYNGTAISGTTDSYWDGVFTTGGTLTGGTSSTLSSSGGSSWNF